jgi:4'-phosphopantetheinyl transferase
MTDVRLGRRAEVSVPPLPWARPATIAWLTRSGAAVPPGGDWLSAGETERAAGLVVPARRQGWLLRRWTAKEALYAVAGPEIGSFRDLDIRNHPDGAPEAFLRGRRMAIGLSLTDRAGWAACAIAPPGVPVGCDLELIEPRSAAFVADYLTRSEQRFVARSAVPALAANLVWSAKESALKVLGQGLRRPTRSVEVHVDASGGPDFAPLTVSLAEGGTLHGRWRRLGPFVLTLAAASADPIAPPLFLGGPVPD